MSQRGTPARCSSRSPRRTTSPGSHRSEGRTVTRGARSHGALCRSHHWLSSRRASVTTLGPGHAYLEPSPAIVSKAVDWARTDDVASGPRRGRGRSQGPSRRTRLSTTSVVGTARPVRFRTDAGVSNSASYLPGTRRPVARASSAAIDAAPLGTPLGPRVVSRIMRRQLVDVRLRQRHQHVLLMIDEVDRHAVRRRGCVPARPTAQQHRRARSAGQRGAARSASPARQPRRLGGRRVDASEVAHEVRLPVCIPDLRQLRSTPSSSSSRPAVSTNRTSASCACR
jgi:hypothetical protein